MRPMKSREPLTAKQQAVLAYITDRTTEGRPPSFREIAKNFGWSSVAAAQRHVAALIRKGALKPAHGETRGVNLPHLSNGVVGEVPLVDQFDGAGTPLKIANHLALSVTFHPGDPSLAFNAPDSAMKRNGILEWDLVFVRTDLAPQPGDLVAVVIDGVGHAMTQARARSTRRKVIGVVRMVTRAYGPHGW